MAHDNVEGISEGQIRWHPAIVVKHGPFSRAVSHDLATETFGCKTVQEQEGLEANGTFPEV